MSVKKVKEIKNIDAFDSFIWNGSVLKKFNLIYGWNGSGKTTLSRIFNFLERSEIHLEELKNITFNIDTDNGQIKNSGIKSHNLNIKVFNEDFIKDHVAFDESKAKKIIMIGKENIGILKEIETLENQLTTLKQAHTKLLQYNAKLPKLEDILKDAGSEVTKQFGNTPLANHRYYGRTYNRSKVEKRIEDGIISEANIKSLIISSQSEIDAKRDIIKNEKANIPDSINTLNDFSVLFSTANELLKKTVKVVNIEKLENDKELRDWIEIGYHIHKKRSLSNCEFCTHTLGINLLEHLGNFFTDELEKTQSSLKNTLTKLEESVFNPDKFTLDSGKLFGDLTERFNVLKKSVSGAAAIINGTIENLVTVLKEKNDYFHDSKKNFVSIDFPIEQFTNLNKSIIQINELISEHNDRVKKKSTEIEKAAESLELNTIASILDSKEYFSKKLSHDCSLKEITASEGQIKEIGKEIRNKKASLQNASIAVDKINLLLKEFFGKSVIYLEVNNLENGEVGYVLKRRNKNAKHLSEGEKSVLALIYFFIKLEEEGCDKKNCLIIIDDPVDSQDGIFLFRTFGLLKRQLKDAEQLVLLTHNFDFFNLVRDWLSSKEYFNKSQLYLIKCEKTVNEHQVNIEDLPDLLKDYKSEYQYLFSRLYRYSHSLESLDEPLVANISRKVLEYFAGFKWSCRSTEQFTSIVLSRFIGDENELKRGTGDFVVKFLHEYSHGQDFSRAISASMLEAPAIAENVLAFIKIADQEHYDHLKSLCEIQEDTEQQAIVQAEQSLNPL